MNEAEHQWDRMMSTDLSVVLMILALFIDWLDNRLAVDFGPTRLSVNSVVA